MTLNLMNIDYKFRDKISLILGEKDDPTDNVLRIDDEIWYLCIKDVEAPDSYHLLIIFFVINNKKKMRHNN